MDNGDLRKKNNNQETDKSVKRLDTGSVDLVWGLIYVSVKLRKITP